MLGHNQPSFDTIVEENLLRGLYLSQRDALIAVARDPRCEQRHIRVLAEIIDRMNTRTGMAYPGRAALAKSTRVLPGGQIDEEGGYTERGVGKTIQDLMRFGYLVQSQRAAETGGRALSHYTIARPSVEELRREISEFIDQVRSREPRKFSLQLPDDDTYVGVTTPDRSDTPECAPTSSGDTPVGGDTDVGVPNRDTHVVPAGDTYVVPTVTSKRTSNKKGPPADAGSLFTSEFETFWAAFPPGRKTAKGDAADVFHKITTGKNKKLHASASALIDGARRYAGTKPDPDYTPMPSTWLNQGRWLDDTPTQQTAPWWKNEANLALMTDERWEKGIAENRGKAWPVHLLSPPPGHPECKVPKRIIEKLGLADLYDSRGLPRGRS